MADLVEVKVMRKIIYSCLLIMSLLAVFYIVYGPAIKNRYLFLEDYDWLWTSTYLKDSALKTALGSFTWEGRTLQGIFVGPTFDYINYHKSIDATIPIRFVGLIGITLLAYIIFTIFRVNRFKDSHAFLLSISICTLPPYLAYISYLICIAYIYAAAFSAIAALLMCNIYWRASLGERPWPIMHVLTAITCIIIALLIFQPAAMLYWPLALIPIVMHDNQPSKKRWLQLIAAYFIIGLSSIALYWGLTKSILFFTGVTLSWRAELIQLSDIPHKIQWFIRNPLRNALNLWDVFPSNKLGFTVLLIITAGIFYNPARAIKEKKNSSFMNSLLKLSLIMSALLLSYLPNLLIKDSWASYRTMVSLTTAVCILFGYAIINIVNAVFYNYSQQIKKIIIAMILSIVTAYGCYLSYTNLNKYIVMPQIKEVEYVKDAINSYGVSNLMRNKNIYIRLVSDKALHAKGFLYEFGQISSQYCWATMSFSKKVLYDFGIEEDIHIECIDADDPLPINNHYLVIDMKQFDFMR